jgi:thiol-disulfide isomerase/thioredoxin
MTARLLILLILAAASVVTYQGFRRWQLWRVTRSAPRDPLLAHLRPGIPAIVYFTTPMCAPCKTQQRPALARLLAELGDHSVQVIEVDALAQPDVADRWGVLSVPTTFVLDPQGRPAQVNYGVAGTDKLRQQLQHVGV